VSWASYAADFSRYLPADSSSGGVFGYTFGGLALAYIFIETIGIAAGSVISDQTAEGVRTVMGGGALGAAALAIIALASVGSGVMNDYSGSLALQTLGVRVRRPLSSVVVTTLAFGLILWLHAANTAVVIVDWRRRSRGRATVDPATTRTPRADALVALTAFVVAYAAAIPFMNTTLLQGPVARAWHGADLAYFVNFFVALAIYGGYRRWRAVRP
jgi:NCS1 family nucleobase:cation symporter-1